MTPCFIINLEKDAARRENISRECRAIGLSFEIVRAVYGKELTAAQLTEMYDAKKAERNYVALAPNEIAASLSHISIYRRMIAEKIPRALILEDDARLCPALVPVLAALEREIPEGEASLTLLTFVGHYSRRAARPLPEGRLLVRPDGRHQWLAHGYFVTLGAARKLAAALLPVWLPPDHWSLLTARGIVKIRAVAPYCIGHSEFARDSNLEAGRQRHRRRRASFQAGLIAANAKILDQLKKPLRPFMKISRQKQTW
jgi:glycosyl transferase family 25